MESESPSPPPRFRSGGGFGVNTNYYLPHQNQYHDSSPHNNHHRQHNDNNNNNDDNKNNDEDEDAFFKQMIAQRMIGQIPQPPETPHSTMGTATSTTPRGYHHRHQDDDDIFGHDEISKLQLIPPWEMEDANNNGNGNNFNFDTPNNTTDDNGNHEINNHHFPNHFFHSTNLANNNNNSNINNLTPTNATHNNHITTNTNKENNITITTVIHPPPPSAKPTFPSATPTSTTNNNNNNNNNNGPSSSTTPRVSFGTHDQIHQWDEQLDILKHVNDEFFNVAHFLLDIVGVTTGVNEEENYYFVDECELGGVETTEEDEDGVGIGVGVYGGGGTASSSIDSWEWNIAHSNVPLGGRNGRGGGSKLLSWLGVFNCGEHSSGIGRGGGGEDYNPNVAYNPQVDFLGIDDDNLEEDDDEMQQQRNQQKQKHATTPKKYKLTEKLIRDFELAVQFRMENIKLRKKNAPVSSSLLNGSSSSSKKGEEKKGRNGNNNNDDEAAKTMEIARKIKAYGLPMKRGSGEHVGKNGVHVEGSDEDLVKPGTPQLEKSRKNNGTRYIPSLPELSDDDDEDAVDENNNLHSTNKNQSQHNAKHQSPNTKSPRTAATNTPTSKSTASKIPTPTAIFNSIFKTKSSTPSKEECQTRLQQIRREIDNVQKMSDTTQNKDVQSACRKRISKLKDEMRFCQIVKERHKIQSMLESSGVEEVKLACRERLKQLVLELDMLNLEEDILELKVAAKEGDVIGKVGQENEQWYQRVLQYVAPSEHEEHQGRDLRASPSHHGAESRSVGWHSHTNHDKFRGPLHHVQNQQPWREDYRRRTSEPNYHQQQYSPHSPRYQNRPVQQSPIRGPPADPWRILTPRSGFSGNTSSSTPTNKDRIIQQQQYHNFGRQEGPAAKAVKSNGLDELITYLAS